MYNSAMPANEIQAGDRISLPDATLTVRSVKMIPGLNQVQFTTAIGEWTVSGDETFHVDREEPELPSFEIIYSKTEFWTCTVQAENAHEAVNTFHRDGYYMYDSWEVLGRDNEIRVLSAEPLD